MSVNDHTALSKIETYYEDYGQRARELKKEGKKIIGKELGVVVTSVLQTTAGRMIFARARDEEVVSEKPTSRAGEAHG